MNGTFGTRLDELAEAVGHGHLKSSVKVDQIYAHYQHEHPEFHHPDGGQAFYLRDPMFAHVDIDMQAIADRTITREGSEIKDAMADWAEHISDEVYALAPLEFGDLKASGHPVVEDDGFVIYDRAPRVHRLSEEELRIKGHLRALYEPDRYRR